MEENIKTLDQVYQVAFVEPSSSDGVYEINRLQVKSGEGCFLDLAIAEAALLSNRAKDLEMDETETPADAINEAYTAKFPDVGWIIIVSQLYLTFEDWAFDLYE